MMENIEQNLNNSANEVFANSYSNLNNNDFFYDTKEDEFIDTDNADSSKNSFSENEVNKVGFSSDVISALQSKVEDAINNENMPQAVDNNVSENEPFTFSGPQIQPLPFDEEIVPNEIKVENLEEKEEKPQENIDNVSSNENLNTNIEEPVEVASSSDIFNTKNDEKEEKSDSIPEITQPESTENKEEIELPSLNIEPSEDANAINKLDDSYALSNFDVLFDSLYSDVTGANNFISNLIEQKRNVNVNEANLAELTAKFEREKEEFNKFVEAQKQAIENEKRQCSDYIKTQKQRLQNEETQFNSDCESTRAELNLAEQTLKVANEKLSDEREQFEKSKNLEEEKLKSDRQKLELEREQFEKEKTIALEKIKNGQKELQLQKEQFAKSKELEEKKLELESKNLSQSCARFKELVTQFNSGFQQLPDNKE